MSPQGQEILATLVPTLAPCQQTQRVGHGSTANAPVGAALPRQGIAANAVLSQKRAEAVLQYRSAHVVPPDLIAAPGVGETEPIAVNATAQRRAQNRRVELPPAMPDGIPTGATGVALWPALTYTLP
jgi:hypothetical protein